MADYSSALYSDRGYEAKPQSPQDIFNPKKIYGDVDNPAYKDPTISPPSATRPGFSSATTGFSSAGGGSSSRSSGSQSSSTPTSTPINTFEQKAQGFTPENARPQYSSPVYSGNIASPTPDQFTTGRNPNPQETMQIQSQISTNIPQTQFKTSGGSINVRGDEYQKPPAKLSSYSGQFLYEQGEKAKRLQEGDQFSYEAGAVLGVGVGIGRFAKDTIYDLSGQGLSEIPLTRFATGVWSFVSDVPGSTKSVVDEFIKNPYESAGYAGAPSIFGAVSGVARGGFIRLVSKDVSTAGILSERGLGAVEAGSKTYPTVSSIKVLETDFLKTITPEGNIKVITGSPSPLTTGQQSRIIQVGESRLGARNMESSGLYVSPYGEGNPAFLDIIQSDSIKGFSILPKINNPTLSVIDVPADNFGRIPTTILQKGISAENTFLKSDPGKLYVTGNVERAFNPSLPGRSTREFEGVLTPGTVAKSTGGIFGFTERVTISGTPVPLRTYLVDNSVRTATESYRSVYKLSSDNSFKYSPQTRSYVYESGKTVALSDFSGILYGRSSYKEASQQFGFNILRNNPVVSSTGSNSDTFTRGGSGSVVSAGRGSSVSGGSPFSVSIPIISNSGSRSVVDRGGSGGSGGSSGSLSSVSSGSSYISQPIYRNIPITTTTPIIPAFSYFKEKKQDYFGRRIVLKEKIYKAKSTKYESFILPDLFSVSQTERSLFNYGSKSNRAIAPRATPKVQALSLKAFRGYSSGFVPTEQMRIKLRL